MSIITNLRFNRHINVTVLRCPIIYNISYGWKNVTKCPSGREADMPVDFLTTEQTESYGALLQIVGGDKLIIPFC